MLQHVSSWFLLATLHFKKWLNPDKNIAPNTKVAHRGLVCVFCGRRNCGGPAARRGRCQAAGRRLVAVGVDRRLVHSAGARAEERVGDGLEARVGVEVVAAIDRHVEAAEVREGGQRPDGAGNRTAQACEKVDAQCGKISKLGSIY